MQTTEPGDMFPEPLAPARGRLTLVFVVVIAIGLVVAQGLEDPGDTDASLSGVAPEVVLIGFDGAEWRLSSHLVEDGRPVVLNLWASWCIPCRDEIPELSAFSDSHPTLRVVGVAVNDQPADARRLADELEPTYLVGVDATGRLRDLYPSVGMPFTILIDSQGIIRWSKPGGVTADELESVTAGLG